MEMKIVQGSKLIQNPVPVLNIDYNTFNQQLPY